MTRERSMFSSYTPKMDSNENIVFGDNFKGDVIGLSKVAITSNTLKIASLEIELK
jgi:hypothetical protein